MKKAWRWIACLVLACGNTIPVRGQAIRDVGYRARLKLTCTTSLSNRLVRSSLTEGDVISVCATQTMADPSHVQLFFLGNSGQLAVVDIVSSNVICSIATLQDNECLTNVAALARSGATDHGVVFTPCFSVGDGALPADFA